MKQAIELLRRADAELVILRHKGGWMAPCKYIRNAAKYINEVIALLRAPPWETLEQWEKRTGKPWQDDWAVYARWRANGEIHDWSACSYKDAKDASYVQVDDIICATEAGPPPDTWEPEEEK
jgi:hypothetical protein